jgi:hypothetical protein
MKNLRTVSFNDSRSWKRTADQKEIEIFLICKEIQLGSVAKSYMRKGFLIYEEMRRCLTIYEEAVSILYMTCNRSLLNFLNYEEFFFLFY